MGVSGFGLHDYHVDDSDLLYPPDSAFKSALNSINGARTYVAAMCCGMLYTGLELALEYGSQRRTFGQLLSSRQGLNWLLADVATDYEAARALTERATVAIEAGKDAVLAAAHAKKFATRIAVTRLADWPTAFRQWGLMAYAMIFRWGVTWLARRSHILLMVQPKFRTNGSPRHSTTLIRPL